MKEVILNKLLKIAGVSAVALSAALYASSATKTLAADITKKSDLKNFSKIKLSSSADIKISMGDNYSIEMSGDEERINDTILEVTGDTLLIRHKERFFSYNNDQDMMITVVMPNIESMQINGSGDGEIIGVNNERLELSINGSGDLNVSGKSQSMEFNINGSGDITMDEVSSKDVEVSINGSGDVKIGGGSCQSLDIQIHGSGDVEAKDLQCQNVEVDVSGSGDSRVYAINSLTFDSHGSGNVDVYGKPQKVVGNDSRRRNNITIH